MKEVKITIDGQKLIAQEGKTVLEIATEVGIKIPTLCAMPELGFTPGSCRVCVIEIEGCLLYTSPSPRDRQRSRMPSSA